jgi:clan AA aspartic protease (TIGR02281 family)
MAINRVSVTLLSTLLLMLACASSTPASDIDAHSQDQGSTRGEAATFFKNLADKSNNPLIVSMAQESLRQLRDPEAKSSHHKPQTEVQLLPQFDNTYVVPALVNQHHAATFLVDTGASYTVITPKMARQLGIRLDNSVSVPVSTANGTVQAPLVTIKRLSLGSLQIDNVEAVVADLGGDANPISGLLGMSFFHGMDLTFHQDRLVITP